MVGWIIHPIAMKSTKVAIMAVLAALSIGSNYAMMSLYNVKFMDLIVFVAGFCFGPLVGGFTGVLSWSVYGVLNPLGFSLPIWVATMLSEAVYGVVGGLLGRSLAEPSRKGGSEQFELRMFFGTLGVFLTLLYDVITTIVFVYVGGQHILTAIIMGVPFILVHVLSNALFFGLGCVPAIRVIMKTVGGRAFGIPEK